MGKTRKTVLVPPLSFDPLEQKLRGSCALGVLTVATILRDAGEAVSLVNPQVAVEERSEEEIITGLARQILADEPEIIGFSTTCGFYALTLLVAEECKRLAPASTVVLGGPQASATFRETLEQCPWIDIIAVGEADLTVLPLWERLSAGEALGEIPGLAWRDGGEVRSTGPARRPSDLDQLPLLDYQLLPRALWEQEPYLTIEAGRGCPYRCRFCSTSVFWGRPQRIKSASRIREEMCHVAQQTGRSSFYLAHDMLAARRAVLEELCSALAALQHPLRWTCSARVDALDQRLLEQMARGGCGEIRIGLESASERIQELIDKKIDLPRAWDTFDLLRHLGIRPAISLMIGFPDETEEELLETLALALDVRHEWAPRSRVQIFVLAPLAGTELLRRYEPWLEVDRFFNPTLDFLPFGGPRCASFIRDHPELCSAAYHYRSSQVRRETVVKISLVFRQVREHAHTFELLQRTFKGRLAEVLYQRMDAFRLEALPSLQSIDALEEETEHYLEAVWGDAPTEVPYWRDLYRYEFVWLRLRRRSEEERRAGLVLTLTYDVRGLGERFQREEGIPTLPPAANPLRLWCVEIEGKLRGIPLSPTLAASLGFS